MIQKILFTVAALGLSCASHSTTQTPSKTQDATMLASGGGNCPIYYGCPAPPPPAPKGGGGGGGNPGGCGGGKNGGEPQNPV
jgi:hypothetical protein